MGVTVLRTVGLLQVPLALHSFGTLRAFRIPNAWKATRIYEH